MEGKMKILDVPHTNITEMKQSPGSVFDKVKESNPDVYVFKNNKPYGVVMTTDQYEAMYNKTEMLQDRLEEYVIRERNDVGPAAFPRHGTKPMSGQRCFPEMAQNRCRASSVSPTWHKTDVGAEVFPRRGIKTMSGQRLKPPTNTKPPEILMISGGSLSILYMLFFNYCFRLLNFLNSLTSHFAPYPKSGQQNRNSNTEVTKDRVEEEHNVYEYDKAQEVPGNHTDYECDFIFSAV